MNDAKWLMPEKQKNSTKFAFFSFSGEKTNMPDKPVVQREDNTGRTTRSLPLYLSERINLDTTCKAENHIFVVKDSGPVISGKEWDINTLLKLFKKDVPRYLVTGHIKQDYLDTRTTITLRVWDTKKHKEMINISESGLFSESRDVASEIPVRFFEMVTKNTSCKLTPSKNYPAPTAKTLPPYMDALGQLLIQTLADNELLPAKSIWGEENMLNWYLTLWQHFPKSDAPKLMYIRGLLASIDYGGIGKEKFVPGLLRYLKNMNGSDDVLEKLSPLVYAKLGDAPACELKLVTLKKKATGEYAKWLNSLNCNAFNSSLNQTTAHNSPAT